ncbi:hypothetical protein PHMEG_0006962 [Phytophthora megakarya]|uniref:Eukaryotic/viral aspartic protease n=1 Tax=Phytophthora megakarya TaxID=4795 RepID=A0A225WPH1_9STRA|nr:hypothetical protein PHMEG_0006962 [Phytophthora megakarya]
MAVPATETSGGGHNDFETPVTNDLVTSERSISFTDSVFIPDTQDEDEYVQDDTEVKAPVQKPDLSEDVEMFVTKSGGVKSILRNLADEFDEVGDP